MFLFRDLCFSAYDTHHLVERVLQLRLLRVLWAKYQNNSNFTQTYNHKASYSLQKQKCLGNTWVKGNSLGKNYSRNCILAFWNEKWKSALKSTLYNIPQGSNRNAQILKHLTIRNFFSCKLNSIHTLLSTTLYSKYNPAIYIFSLGVHYTNSKQKTTVGKETPPLLQ